ncbi:hypothetical protein Cylst_3157 [Cylindrospermum stagnale PCC 7417]|uniref:Uncharacterized protein n=1 Tax=Cylindrospermum stagnale PCC 7417 TaxID=56107 RepID=K9WZU8_9NOST|nr:hypothetical protein [Cylindrospermum stagnale]AFZ25321.1 hypothetical protein Cylst_3157 [Cylindrospermum stagnale PCC 7417]
MNSFYKILLLVYQKARGYFPQFQQNEGATVAEITDLLGGIKTKKVGFESFGNGKLEKSDYPLPNYQIKKL